MSHRRRCDQNTVETQRVQLSNEVVTSRCETTGGDDQDSAGNP